MAFNQVTMGELAGPFEHLVAALDECAEVGYVSPDKRDGAELTCWAGVHGFAMLYSTGPLRDAPARARAADLARLLDRIEDGLSS